MAVASLQPPAVVYREEQYFDWRVYALMLVVQMLVTAGAYWLNFQGPEPRTGNDLTNLAMSLGSFAAFVFPTFLVVGLLRMTTEVRPTDLCVWFGWIPSYRRVVSLGSVVKIEVVSYRPMADYGGWGIRRSRSGERALIARGNRGVQLELSDGSRLLIGSQKPELLALAIESAVRPGV